MFCWCIFRFYSVSPEPSPPGWYKRTFRLNDWGVRAAPALLAVLVVLTVSARFGGKDPYMRDHPAFLHLSRAQSLCCSKLSGRACSMES